MNTSEVQALWEAIQTRENGIVKLDFEYILLFKNMVMHLILQKNKSRTRQ